MIGDSTETIIKTSPRHTSRTLALEAPHSGFWGNSFSFHSQALRRTDLAGTSLSLWRGGSVIAVWLQGAPLSPPDADWPAAGGEIPGTGLWQPLVLWHGQKLSGQKIWRQIEPKWAATYARLECLVVSLTRKVPLPTPDSMSPVCLAPCPNRRLPQRWTDAA